MLSRRNFLKLTGVAAAAIGSGYSAGKIIGGNNKNEFLRVQAFLPDQDSVGELSGIISRKLNGPGELYISAEDNLNRIVKDAFSSYKNGNDGKVNIRIEKLNKNFNSDILFSDNSMIIYDPNQDFNASLVNLRKRIKDEKPVYAFTAEYKNENIFSSLFNSGKKNVVIENENGIFDKIELSAAKDIWVKGPAGSTGIRINNNSVHIFSSCCRNGICKHSGGISDEGNIIACAPNKILLFIEKV